MLIDGEIESNRIIKQLLEELERSIGSYSVDELIHSLRKYLYDRSHDPTKIHPTEGVIPDEPFGEISFGTSWILLVAIAQKDSPKDSNLKTPSEEQFSAWSKIFKNVLDKLNNRPYCRRFLMNDVIKFPEKIKTWKIVDESLWKDIAPFIPSVCHARIQNERVQSNFVRNACVPIARSYKLTKLFIDGLTNELQKKLTEHIKNEVHGMSLEALHMNLYWLWSIICKQEGILTASEVDQYFQETPAKLIDTTDEKQLQQTASEINSLLKLLSTTSDEISTKYSKIKDALFQQKTMLVNENPFWDTPIYQTVQNGEIVYICPDINLLNLRLETIVIRLVDAWRNNLPEKEKNTTTNIGISRELFLYERIDCHKELFIEGGIVRLDEIEDARRYLDFLDDDFKSLSFADFIVETPENIVIIECKNSLGVWRPFYENIKMYYDSLDRIKKALDQCSKTHKRLKSKQKTKPVFHIVICNENLWIEGAIVGLIFHLGQKYNSSGDKVRELEIKPGNYSILSIAAFDFLLYTKTLDKFIRECRENGKVFKSPIANNDAYDLIIKALNNQFNYHDAIIDQSFEYSNPVLNEINQKAND